MEKQIEQAIDKAISAIGAGEKALAVQLASRVAETLQARIGKGIPTVENVQDIVEEVLMTQGYPDVARAYILYRQQRADVRRLKGVIGVNDDLKLGINAIKVLERRYLL